MMQMHLVQAVIRIIKNTHRHPANMALHCIGAPFYVIGALMTLGHFAGIQTDLAAGVIMWLAAVAMFVAGHKIENNVGSMTPILLFRLVLRKAGNYSVAQRIHFLRG
jgi:hypothetical protein